MATVDVEIIKTFTEDGKTKALHRDPATGLQYVATAASFGDLDVTAAVEAQAAKRKAAGLDYVGKVSSSGAQKLTVTV